MKTNPIVSFLTLIGATLLIGVLGALALAPAAAVGGTAVKRTNETMQSNLADISSGVTPGITTIKDAHGNDMAYLFKQRRHPVKGDEISQHMKDAIVAIEDHRFYEHEGVDLQSFGRALVTNLVAGGVEQGASSIHQQYVKNYLLHVEADSTAEQAAAIEVSIPRKLREMRMATQLDDELSKDEILTGYLNLVPFGNHAYGIEAAARTYFGISADELNVPQSAMLAGMVQSSEYLNPFTNYDAVVSRRNTVLQAMVSAGYLDQASADVFKNEPLGTLDSPALLPNGCIGAGDRGFFCDYVLSYLAEKGFEEDELLTDAYTIHTTLDPQVQDVARNTVTEYTAPTTTGVAEVLNVVKPGQDSRDILAMTSSRNYGLDLSKGETYLPQPTSMVGNGAGSVFKIFTAAAALEQGMGLDTVLPVPTRYEAKGMGAGGAQNCPPDTYCVENAGTYASQMTLEQALAYSPNTTFIMLIEETGVPATVDMAVRLGLRSYAEPGSHSEDQSIADYFKEANLASFVLGPTAVNPLELSNVGATIASHGMWCEPNPIRTLLDRDGNEVFIERPDCEQAVEPGVADALADGMSRDSTYGTAANAARGYSGDTAAKTGTTESNRSSAFLGFNSAWSVAPYIYNDGTTNSPLCSGPVRQCAHGNLYGGREPAMTYFAMARQFPEVQAAPVADAAPIYRNGTAAETFTEVIGLSTSRATTILSERGYTVVDTRTANGGGMPAGVVARVQQQPGSRDVVLVLSDGSGYQAPSRAPAPATGGQAPAAPSPAPTEDSTVPGVPNDPLAELEQRLNDAAAEFLNSF